LVLRYRAGDIASRLLDLIRAEYGAPVAPGAPERLRQSTKSSLERFILNRAPSSRTRLEKSILAAIEQINALPDASRTIGGMLKDPISRRMIAQSVWLGMAPRQVALMKLWSLYAEREEAFDGIRVRYALGFSHPELEGRWTDDDLAVLEIATEAPKGAAIKVRLKPTPYLPPHRRSFRFRTATGVGPMRRHTLRRRQSFPSTELILDARVVGTRARKVVIAFYLPDACRPHDANHLPDTRLLGLFFRHHDMTTLA
jgi:hypothetical protein